MTVRALRLLAPVVMVAVVVGCGSAVPSATPRTNEPPSSSPTPTDTGETVAPTTLGPLLDGQTDTDFGRIWDSVPKDFPLYPGARLSEEAQTGPSSGVYTEKGDAKTIATWYRDRLEAATFRTQALSGPLEDGSFVIDSVGLDAGCQLEIAVAPLGGLTILTILYGAACPHD